MVAIRLPLDVKVPITGKWLDEDPKAWSKDRPHHGVDFGCGNGTVVRSFTLDGVVHGTFDKDHQQGDGSFGRCVVVQVTGTPWFVLYAHLSETRVKKGNPVLPGDIIGLSGGSGKLKGEPYSETAWPFHLHVQKAKSPDFPRDFDKGGARNMSGDPFDELEANKAMKAELDALKAEVAELKRALASSQDSIARIAGDELQAIVQAAGPGSIEAFIVGVTNRFDAIHDGVRDGQTVEEKLDAIRKATFLGTAAPRATNNRL